MELEVLELELQELQLLELELLEGVREGEGEGGCSFNWTPASNLAVFGSILRSPLEPLSWAQ